jgi:CheY-like chemotaxis protein
MMKKKLKILVVEDDIFLVEELRKHIDQFVSEMHTNLSISITFTRSAEDCCEKLEKDVDVVFMDYHLENDFGEVLFPCKHLINAINLYCYDCKVVVVSVKQEKLSAIGLIKNGIYDFIKKDRDIFLRLKMTLNQIINSKLGIAAA